MVNFIQKLTFIALVTTFTLYCGQEADFKGENQPQTLDVVATTTTTLPPGTPPTTTLAPPTTLPQVEDAKPLFWLWDCENGDQSNDPDPDVFDVIPQPGDYRIATEEDEVGLNLSGSLCRPSEKERDIVFVIDVSGSMDGNDPKRNRSCGRLRALQGIMPTLTENDRVSVITFHDKVRTDTGDFLELEELVELFMDSDTLCHGQGGFSGTSYEVALEAARDLLNDKSKARLGANREVYFISDGEPTDGSDGSEPASEIRKTATIATLMLDGDDEQLKKIASKDADGKPIHFKTNNANQLARLLKTLSQPELESADFAIFPLHTPDFRDEYEIDFSDSTVFNLEPVVIRKDEYPQGAGFELLYQDTNGQETKVLGRIFWDD